MAKPLKTVFKSKDGYICKMIGCIDKKKLASKSKYKVQFEDGTTKDLIYTNLASGRFVKNDPSNHIGEIFQGSDGSKCTILKQQTFDGPPSRCKFEVTFEDGDKSILHYFTLKNGDFVHHIDNIIGKSFTNKENQTCIVINEILHDEDKNKCRYKVRFENNLEKEYTYASLRAKQFNDSSINQYIGDEFINKDGYKCKIIRRITFNNQASRSRYEVLFDNNTRKILSYNSLKSGNFLCYNTASYIGQHFTSTEGHECIVVDQTRLSTGVYNCKVRFSDGFEDTYRHDRLKRGEFKKYQRSGNYIGRVFENDKGLKCTIIDKITNDNSNSRCKYKVRFENGVEKTYQYSSLAHGSFDDFDYEYIGKKFTSKDCYICEIVEQTTFDASNSNCRYKVRFDDGTEKEYLYNSLQTGNFVKDGKFDYSYIGRKFTTTDGHTCEIVEQLTFDKQPKYCKFKIKYDDGFMDIKTYSYLAHGRDGFRKFNRKYINISEDEINGYHLCKCNKCNMVNYLSYEEIYEHMKDHILS